MNTTITPTTCAACGKHIKHVYTWDEQTLGIECWKRIALPAIKAKWAAQRNEWKRVDALRDMALIAALQQKDMSRIRSSFKVQFITSLITQYAERGFISGRQREMVYGTGAWNGSFYDHGMLNDTDYLHYAIALYFSGDNDCIEQAHSIASTLGDKIQAQYKEATA